MPSRTSRSRSHNGCLQCRQKHVKCDQTLPICRRCQRNDRPCSLAADYDPNWRMPSTMAEVLNSSRNLVWKTFVPQPQQRQNRSLIDTSSSTQSTPQNVPDLIAIPATTPALSHSQPRPTQYGTRPSASPLDEELFQHFVNVTAVTLGQGDAVLLHIYQQVGPSLARERHYLMDCILAMSGNHRLTTLMQRRSNSTPEAAALQKLVLEYQSQALHSYSRGMNTAQSIEDCTAVAIAGILVLMFTFADRQNPERDPSPASRWALSKSFDIFKLQAGIGAFMQSNWDLIAQSELKALLNYPLVDQTAVLHADTAQALSFLAKLIEKGSLPRYEIDLFNRALHGLRNVLATTASKENDVGHRLGWLVGRDVSSFAEMMQLRKPEALLIAAYWAVSLQDWPNAWWEQGLGREIVREVAAELGERYQPYMAWPLQQYKLLSTYEG